jgi:cytochrome o ubiquinol oxidase subunit II
MPLHGLDFRRLARERSPVVARMAVASGAALALTGCQSSVLDPAGPVGAAEKMILIDSLIIMLAIVVPTVAAIFAFAWWFRASNKRAVYRPGFVYSGEIELLVWSIPLLVITLLGGVAWISSHDLDPAVPLASATPSRQSAQGQSQSQNPPQVLAQAQVAPLEVQGVSLDWKWLFIYPAQGVASVNQLVLPAGVPVHFSLTSASVLNTFFVPQLGSMIYTMNGMRTQLNLRADRQGTFHGQSSHYSGDGFSDMHFDVHAVTPEQFAAWAATARDSGRLLDDASYAVLENQSIAPEPIVFRLADPALFNKIVTQIIPPGPGPTAGRPNVEVSPRSAQQ